MEVKCEYCNSLIPDDATHCPNCGAPNQNMQRAVKGTPKTIAELEQWYKDRNLPPYEVTRFFIGIDCKEPKAFGIYKDGDEYIVYKNKTDGERAVRYRGKDEDYAVNELYLKLKSEILAQKAAKKKTPSGRKTTPSQPRRRRSRFTLKHILLLIVVIVIVVIIAGYLADRGGVQYYQYQGNPYVYYNNNYYAYDPDLHDYYELDDDYVPQDLINSSEDYQVNSSSDTPYFSTSDYGSSNDGDSSYNWDDDDSWNSSIFDYDDDSNYNWNSDDSWSSWGSDDSWSSWDSGDSWSSWDSDW